MRYLWGILFFALMTGWLLLGCVSLRECRRYADAKELLGQSEGLAEASNNFYKAYGLSKDQVDCSVDGRQRAVATIVGCPAQ